MKFKTLSNLLVEMPINKFVKLGSDSDWSKRAAFDKQTFNDLKDKNFEDKVRTAFKGTDTDFNFFFINDKELQNEWAEFGNVPPNHQIFDDLGVDESIFRDEDSINIIFLGNSGDALVNMTPWILARRIGHVFRASRGLFSIAECFRNIEETIAGGLEILLDDYNLYPFNTYKNLKRDWFNPSSNNSNLFLILLNIVGTFKSARENKILRPYEFIYECFSQYLLYGAVKPATKFPKTFAFKDSSGYSKRAVLKDDADTYRDYVGWFTTLDFYFEELLSSAVGEVFIM